MKKFIYTPLWRLDRAEKILGVMETNGYRLKKIVCTHWYYFDVCKPKETNYFFTYKGFLNNDTMGSWDYSLLSNHNANEIKTSLCQRSVYRLTESQEKTNFLKNCREDFIKSRILERFIPSLLLLVLFILVLVFGSNDLKLFTLLFIPVLLFITVSNFIGYIIQCRKCKKIERNIKNDVIV